MFQRYVFALVALSITGCQHEAGSQTPRVEPPAADRAPNSSATSAKSPDRGLLEAPPEQPEEYGAVRFGRDLDAALAESKQTGKPVFLLFTEVPGCNTVKGFANGPLSHPLVVEAIETEFVPVVVRNNVTGFERKILEAFGEPTWNNPAVRFIDHRSDDLVPRYASGWTTEGLVHSMRAALERAGRPVPVYFNLLDHELSARTAKTLFSMDCFWSGEVGLAGLAGVVATRPGFANGREVVEVTWDLDGTSLEKLVAEARFYGSVSGVVATDEWTRQIAERRFDDVVMLRDEFRPSPKDDKYQLLRRAWGWVPMTRTQAMRVNRAVVTEGEGPADYLSPRQVAMAKSDERFDGQTTAGLKAPNAR